MKKTVICTAALVMTIGAASAADPSWLTSHGGAGASSDLYTGNELSVDVFGSYINPERRLLDLFRTNMRNGWWGGGGGLNYFVLKYVGLGADVNLSDHPGPVVDEAGGNLILRLPLGNSGFAPYALGGGGRMFNPSSEWFYGGGIGVEYRFTRQIGVFTDGRFLWSNEATVDDRLLVRAGLRFVF